MKKITQKLTIKIIDIITQEGKQTIVNLDITYAIDKMEGEKIIPLTKTRKLTIDFDDKNTPLHLEEY